MTYLTAAVVLVGAVSAVNLVLVLGIVQRLRQLTAAPAASRAHGPVPRPVLDPGTAPEPFQTSTMDGESVDAGTLGGSLVGFFTPNCSVCQERLPDFVAHAGRVGLDRDRVLAVVIGEPDETVQLRAELAPVARIVTEPHGGGAMYRAFAVAGLPAYFRFDDGGAVLASGTDLVGFPVPAGSGAGRRG